MSIKTPLCDMLGCETPILLAGMGGIAGPELVAAVTNAGGFGVFGSALDVANKGPEELLAQIKQISVLCKGKPFGVDILVHGAEGGVMKQLIDAFADGGAKAFISGKGVPRKDVIAAFHARGMLVASIAGKVSHATRAVELGVDFVIVQGSEGGGHTGEIFTSVLVPQVIDAVAGRVPVVAAGGIYDGRGMAAMLSYGAQGVWVGTRFMLTPEAHTHALYKERLLRATSDDTVVTTAYTGSTLRVLNNPYVEKFARNPNLLEKSSAEVARRAWNDGVWKLMHSGDASNYEDSVQAYVVGQNIGALKTLVPAGDVVREMSSVAAATLVRVRQQYCKTPGRVHTPLCDMLGIQHPIILAGMGGIAGKDAVAAVTNAGGLGTFGSALDVANKGPEELLAEIKDIAVKCKGGPFGVDILVHGAEGGVMQQLIDAFANGGAKLFVSGKGVPRRQVIDAFHKRGMLVGSIAGKVSHATRAVDLGVDLIIVQGSEGGGHTGAVGLSVLLPQVVDLVGHRVPVVAAGGVFDGRGLAAALCWGAQAVWVGTRFMMSPEAHTNDKYKELLLKATSDDTMVTRAYSGSPMRVIRNPYVTRYEENPSLLEENTAMVAKRAWADGVWKLHSGEAKDYDPNNQALVTGQNIGAIKSLKGCGDITRDMVKEAYDVMLRYGGAMVDLQGRSKL